MLQITSKSSSKDISDYIANLREKKGKEKEVLALIKQAQVYGNDFVVNLFWELALTYQHLVMNEDAKGDNGDKKLRSQHILKMEEAVKHAGYFIVRFDQEKWKHRLYRFLGRVCDYKGEYKRAISYYKKSIKYSKSDPDYLKDRYPRWLEIEAFLSYSLIMSGQIGKGHTMAENLFEKFDTDKDALYLKKIDYAVWVIWKTGIPIRTINALMDKRVTFERNEVLAWLGDAEDDLNTGNKNLWADLSYRRDEMKVLRERIRTYLN